MAGQETSREHEPLGHHGETIPDQSEGPEGMFCRKFMLTAPRHAEPSVVLSLFDSLKQSSGLCPGTANNAILFLSRG